MAKKITKEQLNAPANDNGYDAILCDDTISEAVLFLNGQANKNNLDDLSQLIADGANGKQVREEMYGDIKFAVDYFEKHRLEINDNLAADGGINPMSLSGMDKNDPLCFGVLNKIRLAQWQFEYAMAAIAQWFEDDLDYYQTPNRQAPTESGGGYTSVVVFFADYALRAMFHKKTVARKDNNKRSRRTIEEKR